MIALFQKPISTSLFTEDSIAQNTTVPPHMRSRTDLSQSRPKAADVALSEAVFYDRGAETWKTPGVAWQPPIARNQVVLLSCGSGFKNNDVWWELQLEYIHSRYAVDVLYVGG